MNKDFRSTKRRWIKLYPIETLNGSIRYQLSSAERGVWFDLLCFSSLCSNTGDICDRDGKTYPMDYIANRLNIKMALLKSTLQKCVAEGRIVFDDNGIHITNWKLYQSEYDRQKPYREAKKSSADEELAHQKAHQERVSNMTSEEQQADTLRLIEEYDRLHPNGNPKPKKELIPADGPFGALTNEQYLEDYLNSEDYQEDKQGSKIPPPPTE